MGFTIEIGESAPGFDLKGVDDQNHALSDYEEKNAVVVLFTCNHCPTAVQYEDRLIALQEEFEARGVQLVAINPNEDEGHPTDSFKHMVERAREKGFNFPYLRDASQEVAESYGAVRTPHAFLLDEDRTVVYEGRIDDSPDDPESVGRRDLAEAIEEVLAGREVSVPQTKAVGCSVKWWGKDPHWMPAE